MYDLGFQRLFSYWSNKNRDENSGESLLSKLSDIVANMFTHSKFVLVNLYKKAFNVATSPMVKSVGIVVADVLTEVFVYSILGLACILMAMLVQAHNSLDKQKSATEIPSETDDSTQNLKEKST